MADVPAHDQKITHTYHIAYPAHEPRGADPHLHEFREFKARRRAAGTWWCDFAADHRSGDMSECDMSTPLEAHHTHIEFALLNGVDIALLETDFPGISTQSVGAWLDGDENLTLLCARHHRSHGGVHCASAADWEGEKYIRGLIT